MSLATSADVTTLWGKSPEPEVIALISRRLEQVERTLIRRIPDLIDRAEADPVFRADVIDIESDAVLRLVRNPEGFLSETDGSYTYMLQSGLSSGKLSVLREEWERLGVRVGGMFSLAPSVGGASL